MVRGARTSRRCMLDLLRTGVGFVDFLDIHAVESAIMTLNGIQLPDGQLLTVSQKAKQMEWV